MTQPNPEPVQIRKYPNRRLYDPSQSRHLTHDELYDLVAGGRTVIVTDSKTGQDITNVVLAQVLIERDPLKLAAFPPAMLHQLIRTNEQILHSFITRYFNQVMEAFLAMRSQFESMLPAKGPAMPLTPFDWAMAMMRGTMPPPAASPSPPPPPVSAAAGDDIETLRERLEALATELASMKSTKKKKSRRRKA
jgi:polyhydroxyalkanoate synthesis repressor PhaR